MLKETSVILGVTQSDGDECVAGQRSRPCVMLTHTQADLCEHFTKINSLLHFHVLMFPD